jgi:hypothetical protein
MPLEDELLQWIRVLTPSEKRFVSLIGKARAGSGSQLLELFDWLNKAEEGAPVPRNASFRSNLPTLAVRLRELILDCLRVLHKEGDTNAVLRTSLDEAAILRSKKQWTAAARLLRKTKKLAYETSRYTYVLQCIEEELRHTETLQPDTRSAAFAELRKEEESVIKKHQALRELRFRHDSILALAQQFPFSRNDGITAQVRALADAPVIVEQLASEAYLENALAVNTLGICGIFLRNPESVIERYRALLDKWKNKKAWQEDQADLLLTICKYYQSACFYSTVSPGLVHSELHALKGFEGLPPDKLRVFHETIFHHGFILSLNSGNLDMAIAMISEIDSWLVKEEKHLSEAQVLPFFCNFMVAEFLAGHFAETNKYLNRILQLPNRNVRVDIREFALVLQPIVQYELDNSGLNEYLTRSRKRHFSKKQVTHAFEIAVIRHIELLMRAGSKKEKKKALHDFIAALEQINDYQPRSVPLLGLNEIMMWAVSRKNDVPLPAVFMEEAKKAHAVADQHS